MLLRQDCGRHQNRHLLAVHNSFEGGTQGDLSFSVLKH
jgi:hypothetical protein